jgi:hypothetical protein
MNRIQSLILTAMLLGAAAAGAAESSKPRATNLFIIVINGVRYDDAFGDKNHLYIDNIWNKLRPLGSICTKLDNSELTLPIPAQMSLLTGVWHVLENPLDDSLRPAYPTLFEYWNSVRKGPGNPSYFASCYSGYERLSCSKHDGFGAAYAPVFDFEKVSDKDNAVYEKVVPYIQEKHPSLVYLSISTGIGGKGTVGGMKEMLCEPNKKDGCASDLLNKYYESIIFLDAIVYDLWDRVQQQSDYKDKTVFIVVTSHGRHTNEFHGFGDKCDGCRHLFMLAVGPGIKKNFVSGKKRTLIDVCRTVGEYFELPTPYAKGNVMKELFE